MNDFTFYGPCEGCKKPRFFIRKRDIKLPIGQVAKSQKKLCGKCYKAVKKVIETK